MSLFEPSVHSYSYGAASVGASSLSPAGLAFLTHEEGIVPYAYTDSAGYRTFGLGLYLQTPALLAKYGGYTKANPAPKDVLQASTNEAIGSRVKQLNGYLTVPVSQNQWDALFSFMYNRGGKGHGFPSAIAETNANNPRAAAGYIAGAAAYESNPNIKARRLREAAMYLGSDTAVAAAKVAETAAAAATSPWPYIVGTLLIVGGIAYRRSHP